MMARLALVLIVALVCLADRSVAQTAVESHGIAATLKFEEVVSGHLAQGGKTTIYKAGDYFFESGNIVHTAHNRTKSPTRIVFFEIVPGEWKGPSAIPPRS